MHRPRVWLDRLGAAVSAACGVHCALLAGVFLLWPGLWFQRMRYADELAWLSRLEIVLAVLALAIAGIAMVLGWRRHRRLWPSLLALPGLALIGVGVFSRLHNVPVWGSALVLCGGLLMVAAHWRNLRLMRMAPDASHRSVANPFKPVCESTNRSPDD